MAHDCPACGQACYCDGDDTWMESEWVLVNCIHACGPEEDDLDYGADDDTPRAEARCICGTLAHGGATIARCPAHPDGCAAPVGSTEFCGKSCDHGSPCLLYADHQPPDRHETQHGCIFYDASARGR